MVELMKHLLDVAGRCVCSIVIFSFLAVLANSFAIAYQDLNVSAATTRSIVLPAVVVTEPSIVKAKKLSKEEQVERLLHESDPDSELTRFYMEVLKRRAKGLEDEEIFLIAKQYRELEREYNFQPLLLMAMTEQESSFQKGVVSSEGAVGFNQIMPNTARWMSKLGLPPMELDRVEKKLTLPRVNLVFSAFTLNYYLGKGGNMRRALSYYSNFAKNYPDKVLGKQRKLEDEYIRKYLPQYASRL